MINHDRLFKELVTTFFTEFIELLVPEMSAYLEPTSIEFLDKEIFTDVTEGERHEADVVARARFRGRNSCFVVHVENQAQAQSDFGRRMFRYFARLYEKHAVPVYPVVIFSHDSARPESNEFQLEFPDLRVLHFQFRSIHLRRLHWRSYVRHQNPVAAALMSRMGMTENERPRVKLECLRLLTTLRLDPARMKLISGFIDTYLRLNPEEALRFNQEADTMLTTNERSKMVELTTSWKEEGLMEGLQRGHQEGRQEGREEGRAVGRREECLCLVSRLLQRRFGPLGSDLTTQINGLTLDRLESLAEALLDFASIEDLSDWLKAGGPSQAEIQPGNG